MLLGRSMLIAGAGLPHWAFNPADATGGIVFSNGNRTVSSSTLTQGVRGVRGMVTGKHYFELKFDTSPGLNDGIGISDATGDLTGPPSGNFTGWRTGGEVVASGSSVAVYAAYTANDVIGVAVDATARKVWFAKNGAWQGGGDPTAGTGGLSFTASGGVFPHVYSLGMTWASSIPYPRIYFGPQGFASL